MFSFGYTLLYAGLKGQAEINGTPLWKAPWLPWVAAISGGAMLGGATTNPSGGSGNGSAQSVASPAEAPIVRDIVADIRTGAAALRNGIFRAFRMSRPPVTPV